jgi:glycosyltransferase involved in cell wall biosynthesis
MLSAMRSDKSIEFRPLGNFARHVPPRLHALTENSFTQKALLRAETSLIARSENRAAQSFSRCLLINPHETALLQKRAAVPAGRIDTLPPLLKAAQRVKRNYRGAPRFLFLGLLSLPHNDDGLRTFIRHVWPRVLRRMPDANLRVVGRDPQPELLTAISEFGGGAVSLEGFVPDLRALMAESAAMVNPLRFGSGIKLKVIESLAQGLPVVSSDIGASGVLSGAENGVCLAKTPDEWVDHLDALTAPGHNSETSAAAATHFARVYSRDAVFARYDAIFGFE